MASRKVDINELLAQLPKTDKQLEALLPPPTGEKKDKGRQPDPDPGGPGSKFTGFDPEVTQRMVEELLADGRKSLPELIGRIRDISDPAFEDYRPEYLLHCVAIYVGSAKGRRHRKLVADVLAEQITSAKLPVGVRQCLVRELQWVGSGQVTERLGALLVDEQLCDAAAAALLAIGDAAPVFRRALPKAKGKCRLAVLQALGQLRDGKSVDAIRRALADKDVDTQLCAAWSLSRLSDADSAEALLALAERTSGHTQAKATQACLVLAENLVASGKKNSARDVYDGLRRRTNEKYIRDIASKAIAQLEAT